MLYTKDEEAEESALWGLSYVFERSTEPMEKLLDSVNLHTLSQFVTHDRVELATPALTALGNICTNTAKDVERVLSANGLDAIGYIVLMHKHPTLLPVACWILSNIAAGPPEHVELLIRNKFIAELSQLVLTHPQAAIKVEACWALANSFCESTRYQSMDMVGQDALEAMLSMLTSSNANLVMAVLTTVGKLMEIDKNYGGELKTQFESLGGLSALEGLQLHSNKDIYDMVVKILDQNYKLDLCESHEELIGRSGGANSA